MGRATAPVRPDEVRHTPDGLQGELPDAVDDDRLEHRLLGLFVDEPVGTVQEPGRLGQGRLQHPGGGEGDLSGAQRRPYLREPLQPPGQDHVAPRKVQVQTRDPAARRRRAVQVVQGSPVDVGESVQASEPDIPAGQQHRASIRQRLRPRLRAELLRPKLLDGGLQPRHDRRDRHDLRDQPQASTVAQPGHPWCRPAHRLLAPLGFQELVPLRRVGGVPEQRTR